MDGLGRLCSGPGQEARGDGLRRLRYRHVWQGHPAQDAPRGGRPGWHLQARSAADAGSGHRRPDVLRGDPLCDPNRIAVIGYCFGGTVALEVARSGADVAGVVSFHGGLDTPHPADAKNIRCKVLVLHGGDDPHVPRKDVDAFWDEMQAAGVDWQLVVYGGAVHAFTNPAVGNDKSKGVAYNAEADRRSWEAMKAFFDEVPEVTNGLRPVPNERRRSFTTDTVIHHNPLLRP